MSKKDDALKLALEALEAEHSAVYGTSRTARAITAIREAFMSGTDGAHAPEVREQPVRPYRLLQDNGSKYFGASWDKAEQPRGEATLAPATELREQQSAERGEPLTDERIFELASEHRDWDRNLIRVRSFARAIEAAHGIYAPSELKENE